MKRLQHLEEIAARHPGVDKVYAVQAGREVRVMVSPGALDDDGATLLSHEIARQIEREMEFPGQIKVTVIRESRVGGLREVERGTSAASFVHQLAERALLETIASKFSGASHA